MQFHQNEQLIKDKLFLERVFLLEIEKADRLFVEQNLEALSTKSNRSSFFKLGLLLIYAVLIILLSPLSSPFEDLFSTLSASLSEANNKAIVGELPLNAEVKRQSRESEIAKPREQQSSTLLSTSNDETPVEKEVKETQQATDLVLEQLPTSVPEISLPTSNTEIAAASEIEELLQIPELVLDNLPPTSLPTAPLSTSTAEIPTEKEIEEILLLADIVLEQLPPLPVPKVPLSVSNAEIPPTPHNTVRLRKVVGWDEQGEQGMQGSRGGENHAYPNSIATPQVVEELEDESFEPESQAQINPESGTPEIIVTKEIEPKDIWLGEANVVYHASISAPSEALEEINSSVSDNIQQTEHSLLADEDLRQYLTSTPLSSEPKSNPASVSVESEPRAGVNDQIEAELPEVTVTEASETESTSPTEERPLFADEDLRQYLTSTSLSSEQKLTPASVSVESKLRAGVNERIEAELPEAVETEELETELASPTEERPLFADEDLKKYLTSTPLYSDDVLKQRLNH